MFLIAAAALATASTPHQGPIATAQATATIRVLTSVRVKLDGSSTPGSPAPRDAQLKFADGTSQSAKLVEFQ